MQQVVPGDSTGDRSSGPLSHWPRPLCFVLSGGGSFGAVQVGMIRALHEAGIRPDMVVGTSVGALNAIHLAANPTGAAQRLGEIWTAIGARNVLGTDTRGGTAWSLLRNLRGRYGPGLYRPDALRRLIETNLPVECFEDLAVPVSIVVTDVLVGRPKLLGQGSLAPALQASAAVPGIFPPVEIDGAFYIDGGVSANVPVRPAFEAGARSLIVLNAIPGQLRGSVPRTPIEAAIQASQIMLRNQAAEDPIQPADRHPIIRLPQPTPPALNSFDFSHTVDLMEAGFVATKNFLTDLPELTNTTRCV